ncbi:MAG: 4Fe-4S dicluster domain-containing protein [Planctomycetes bacterium]|nr:4Fe-4S dicluster domain-containing protein [Planctomycetota bacterium]
MRSALPRFSPATFAACSGCDICALACPVWQQTHDVRLTPKGRATALQGGASAEDIVESLGACTLCGSCVPACPERIDLVGMTLGLRADLAAKGRSPLAPLAAGMIEPPREVSKANVRLKTVLLAEERLLADPSLLAAATLRLGGPAHVIVADDTGFDIAAALEAGIPVAPERLEEFLAGLRGALRVVTTEGFLNSFLRKWLPGTPIRSLGESCLALAETRRALRPTDLYLLDARAYHADFERLVPVYDTLRHETGCDLSLDLQHLAITTAANALNSRFGTGPVRVAEQVKWILEGRRPSRVVVENMEDGEAVRRERNMPVVHVAAISAAK